MDKRHKDMGTTLYGILIVIAVSFIVMSGIKAYITILDKYEAAKGYISVLERDFPDYIDVTSGTDEYTLYYRSLE